MTTVYGLRPALTRFANAMEGRLRSLDGLPGKTGWLSGDAYTNQELFIRLDVHLENLEDFLKRVARKRYLSAASEKNIAYRRKQAQADCLDAANYLMMICDKLSDFPLGDGGEDATSTSYTAHDSYNQASMDGQSAAPATHDHA